MLVAFKEITLLIASIVAFAHVTGQREWLWRQIATARHAALTEAKKDWGCPSIFNKSACKELTIAKRPTDSR